MRDVFVTGAAVHPFGKHRGKSAEELGYHAVSELLAATGIEPGQVDIGLGGSVYGGSLLSQRVLQRVGISGQPTFTVETLARVVLLLSTWPGRQSRVGPPTVRWRSAPRTCRRSGAARCR